MAKRYYVDTSIWIDFHENRKDKFRPLGDWAFEFFRMVEERNEKILYSDFVIKELKCKYSEEQINKILSIAMKGGLLENVEIKEKQIQEASKLRRKINIYPLEIVSMQY